MNEYAIIFIFDAKSSLLFWKIIYEGKEVESNYGLKIFFFHEKISHS